MHRDYTPNEHHSVPTPRTVENCLDKETSGQSTRRQPNAGAVEPRQRRTRHLDLQRGTSYQLRPSEIETMSDIGTFRALKFEDVIEYRYAGDPVQARRDLDNLQRQGLILRRTTYPEKSVYLTLSKAAHHFLEGQGINDDGRRQALYHGFVKPREARHDAALYRLYQREAERIRSAGGKITRVVLDFELKRSLYRKLAKLNQLPEAEKLQHKQELAQEYSLPVVQGKIALPDLRLEYEGPDQHMGKVDLELVTASYHAKSLSAKAKTGFALYALPEDAARLRPAASDPGIMEDILTL